MQSDGGFEAAFVQSHDPIHSRRKALVVGRDQGRATFTSNERNELGENDIGRVLIEVAGRLVGKDQRRLVSQGPSHGHTLLLTA